MAIFHGSALFLTGLVIVINLCIGTELIWAVDIPASFSRNSFPDNFVFGAAASAYQLEGAAAEDGRGPSIWDTFTHQHPEKIVDRSTGDVAIDFYHRYKEDMDMLKQIGMDAYRFSISWSRVLPRGKISGGVNQKGIDFYNNVINELISKGIEPYVTLFHWDVPQTLEDEYGGFLHANIVNDFRDYADLCYKEFGDRVKYWITLNEPWTFSIMGYEDGIFAPGRCSKFKENCITVDDTATAPYNVSHNQLLAHAAAVKVYKEKYQMSQMGKIGITLLCLWYVPKTPSDADLNAANRLLDFHTGWFMYPITYGDYPPIMKSYVGSRLPKFTEEQSEMLKGSMDFVGVNYYTTFYASDGLSVNAVNRSYTSDSRAEISAYKDGIPICEPTVPVSFIFLCPSGIRDLVLYIKKNYNDPAIYITENGMGDKDDGTVPLQEALKDNQRTKYYKEHLWYLQKSIEDGASVKGHFAWSMFDNFEWGSGYTSRFGLNYVDYKDGLKRYPKKSAIWYKKFLDKAAN